MVINWKKATTQIGTNWTLFYWASVLHRTAPWTAGDNTGRFNRSGETMEKVPLFFSSRQKKTGCFHLTAHEATKTAMDSSLAKPSHTSGLDFHHLPPPTRLVIDKSPLVSTKCHASSMSRLSSPFTSFFCGAQVCLGGFPCLPLSEIVRCFRKSSQGNHHFYTCDLLKNPEPLVDNRDIHY